jgi:hypothetical protein
MSTSGEIAAGNTFKKTLAIAVMAIAVLFVGRFAPQISMVSVRAISRRMKTILLLFQNCFVRVGLGKLGPDFLTGQVTKSTLDVNKRPSLTPLVVW